MELTDKIRRVYLPMTETGFYIYSVCKRRTMAMVLRKRLRDDRFASFDQSWNYVWNLVKTGKDGLISFVPRRRKTENLSDHRLGTKSLRY